MIPLQRQSLLAPGAWLLAMVLCAWVYWPGLAGPSLLDDGANLRILEQLEEDSVSLYGVVSGNKSGPFGRYLSMLSFGLEKLYFDGGLRGTKQTNLVLHLLIGTMLVLFSRDLFRVLQRPSPVMLGLAVGALWLFAPLLLSTVLYSVQRMAQLSALFVLLSLWAYLRARIARGSEVWAWGLLAALGSVCAPLAKENGILVFPLLLYMEYQVLRYQCRSAAASSRLRRVHLSILLLGIVAAVLIPLLRPDFLLAGYGMRDFSLPERILTEARVLWTYLGQLLWVDAGRLGIFHDGQTLSTGLLRPWTTSIALLAWVAVIFALLRCRSMPLLAAPVFGAGFYLIAHSMESTVIPLELYFEHRNYLPAMGFFITVTGLASCLAQRLPIVRPWLGLLLLLLLGRSLLVLATEAQIWSNQYLFQFAAANRFPDSARGNADSARTMALGGDIDEARVYSQRVRELSSRSPLVHELRDITLYCLAGAPYPPERLADIAATAGDFQDSHVAATTYVLVKEVVDGRCTALDTFALANFLARLTGYASSPESVAPKYYLSMAILENHNQRFDRGLAHVEQLLRREPDHTRALLMKLYFADSLQLLDQREEAMRALLDLDARGLLDEDQRRNLEVFLPPVD